MCSRKRFDLDAPPEPTRKKYYWEYGDISTEERKKYNCGDILENSVECLLCGDTIRSHHRHDYKHCKCGNAMVDGGSWYQRVGCKEDWKTVKINCVYYSDVKHKYEESN